jgi:hypothetical protein
LHRQGIKFAKGLGEDGTVDRRSWMYSLPEKWTVGILPALLSNFFSSARTLRSSFLMRHPLRTIIHDLQSCLHFRVYL